VLINFTPFVILRAVGLIFLVIWLSYHLERYFKFREKQELVAIAMVGVLIIAGVGLEVTLAGLIYHNSTYNYIGYLAEFTSTSNISEQVFLPISENPALHKALRVEYGTGTFSIVDTEHGKALSVTFSSYVMIVGRVDSNSRLGGQNFTLVNRTDEREEMAEYWINYIPGNPSDYWCQFRLVMYSGGTCSTTHETSGWLRSGWNTYWLDVDWGFC
jgi:hypothetical protein